MLYTDVFIDPEPDQVAIETIRRVLASDVPVQDDDRLWFRPTAVTLGENVFGEYDDPDSGEIPVSGYASVVVIPSRDDAWRLGVALQIFQALQQIGRYRLLVVDEWVLKLAEYDP